MALTQSLAMFDAALTMQDKYIEFWTKTLTPFIADRPRKISSSTALTTTPVVAAEDSAREQVMVLGEEVLKIEKQVVPGDTTRVVRTVVNAPVEEQVELLTETVIVERRKPTGEAAIGDDLLSDRTIQMTATTERPVVTKVRRVLEEVVLRTEVTAHVETIRNTVKRDKIEIEAPNRLPAVIHNEKHEQRREKHQNRA